MVVPVTIESALSDFIDIQRERLSPRTLRKYEEVIELLKRCMNGYAYSTLSDQERQMLEEADESGDGGEFCRLFGPGGRSTSFLLPPAHV